MKKTIAAKKTTKTIPPQSLTQIADGSRKIRNSIAPNFSDPSRSGRPSSRPPPLSRKASTPTHDKSARTDSPDVSRILPTEVPATVTSRVKPSISSKRPSTPPPKTHSNSDNDISLADQLDFEYTRYIQTMFKRKLAEAKVSQVNNKLASMQKRITEDQDVLQKTTERLKNITFNKEVEMLYKLKNPNYGRVLETADNTNFKEYLETVTEKMESSQNQLKLKNIELPEGGVNELFEVLKDTLAACDKLKANKNLEVPRVIDDIKENNISIRPTLTSSLEMVPQVEQLILDKLTLECLLEDD
ncbi:uncharacterized protein LOC129005173 [Macrosteles quadrilineatus]|uniref:uncharacterized protein LOC129005173 n=1 Tax=Macrosteles quadrilineatus TaxID=74068 RepID=UPI0023E0D46C|nr:uncharacterized protein LOC129005173 [Macrosteles quadrilineatus]XP_054289970.1 uncharacterized protein LOC129005173 [Macrosteles quadrilineatus]